MDTTIAMKTPLIIPIKAADINVGDYITWGTQSAAYEITSNADQLGLYQIGEIVKTTEDRKALPRAIRTPRTFDGSYVEGTLARVVWPHGDGGFSIQNLIRSEAVCEGMTVRCVNKDSGYFTKNATYDIFRGTDGCLRVTTERKGLSLESTSSRFVLANADAVPEVAPEAPTPVSADLIQNPPHYAEFVIQPIEFLLKNRVEGHTFNIVKYAMRAGRKIYEGMTQDESEIVDMEKTIDYARRRIAVIKGEPVV